MRTLLVVIGWLAVFGFLARSMIAAYAIWLVFVGEASPGLSASDHILQNLPWLGWTITVAYALFPDRFIDAGFAWPAIIFFPIAALVAFIAAWACFAGARRLST